MDAFWGITLSVLVIRFWWKRENKKARERRENRQKQELAIKDPQGSKPMPTQKEKDAEELRKQGYTDELIAVILPTINNGQ